MQAIILAAGMGKRLKNLTANNTKCMVKVNGVTMIERMLMQLDELNLNRIIVVIGYEGQKLIDYIATLKIETQIVYVENSVYDRTNNIYSLALAKDYLLEDDTLLLESDLIFENSVLRVLLDDPYDTLALVDKYESWMDGTVIKVDEDDNIQAFVPGKKFVFEDIPYYYKTVNIYKFSRHFSETHYIPFLEAYTKALGNNEYYEQVLRVITFLDNPEIKVKRLNGEQWYEIDDIQDLDIASSMFAENDIKSDMIQSRYGGYWRYPNLVDYCYLVNPYFPPQKLLNEMKSNFEKLLTQYPSGMKVNSLLAAKNFGVNEENIVIGNGAAELIKCIMYKQKGKVGFIRPTFEEYSNRYPETDRIIMNVRNDNFSYSIDDIMDYFETREISMLVLINPDNPSGNYISQSDILMLADWATKRNIILLVDESFVDFADEQDNTLIKEEILKRKLNLIVVKSISKSYGVPGLRLGVVASGNENLISELKKEVSIWNINSFAEFYMQIMEKYKTDYEESLKKLSEVRANMYVELKKIDGLRPIQSQANYFMVEITNGMTARKITNQMLVKYNYIIKDLSLKIKWDNRQFLRLAIRTQEENEKMIYALKKCLADDLIGDNENII
ncbi:MAG: aminotransferase class I/II-fold pyridoxal phosphate-dependent enzyme [Lachnospiraceae bacterium]|nr:aminotransferase class I/II-fold pyridoxal phosphate-dependent enzyme [Lachnospiraceae bacterium]